MNTLADIKPGEVCKVIKLHLTGAALQRVLTMGFLPGAEIKVLRNAPLLDPFDISVKNTMIAVRKSEAQKIEVEKI